MAETKSAEKIIEKEYVIPLRKEWLKVQSYRRAGRAATAIKKFIARHMRVKDRDLDKVKLDVYLNNELFFRGIKCPPSKIKVKALKEGEIVKVMLAETPEIVKFRKARHLKIHAKGEEKKEEKKEEKNERAEKTAETKEEKSEEKKVEEAEKEKAVEEKQIKEAKMKEKAEKHISKTKEVQFARRSMSRH